MMWIATIIIAVVPSVFVLVSLRSRSLDDVAVVLWVIVTVVLPIVGPIAYFIVDPGTPNSIQTEDRLSNAPTRSTE